jgi:hypothetical protein
MPKHTIYGLYDPSDRKKEVRYVGATKFTPEQRLTDHISGAEAADTYKKKWIRKLLRQNLVPAILVLEVTTTRHWKKREKYWIAYLRSKGSRLTNSTEGGEGLVNPTKNVRARIAKKVSELLIGNQRATGMSHTKEACLAISKGLRESKKFQRSQRKWRGKARYTPTEESKLKISLANLGRPRPDVRALALRLNKRRKGSVWVTDGKSNKQILKGTPIPKGFVCGRLMTWQEPGKGPTKGRRYITNGVENQMIEISAPIPEGFKFGQTRHNPRRDTKVGLRKLSETVRQLKLGFRLITDGAVRRQLPRDQVLPAGWVFVKKNTLKSLTTSVSLD